MKLKSLKIKFDKRYVLTVLATFVVAMFLGFLAHGLAMGDDYARNAEIYRTRAEGKEFFFSLMLGHLVISAALVWLYRQGKDNKPFVGQGVRFGLATGAIVAGMGFIEYFLHPLPNEFICKQIILDLIVYTITGIFIAWMSKKA
jgi:hypothetical protein